jgi:hypothetical protein
VRKIEANVDRGFRVIHRPCDLLNVYQCVGGRGGGSVLGTREKGK